MRHLMEPEPGSQPPSFAASLWLVAAIFLLVLVLALGAR